MPYYARPDQLLSQHEEEVAAGCALRAKKIGLYWSGYVVGLVHDWGKYSGDFVRYMDGIINNEPHAARGSVDHSTAGAQFIWNHFPEPVTEDERFFRQMLCLCCVSHHEGCLINCLKPGGIAAFEERMSKEEDKSHYEEICGKVPEEKRKKVCDILNSSDFREEMSSFHEKLVRENTEDSVLNKERLFFQYGMTARYLLSCLVDADHASAAGAEKGKEVESPDWAAMMNCLRKHLSSFKNRGAIDDLRAEIGKKCLKRGDSETQLFLLTLPTGGGKTFSSLSFALAHAKRNGLDRIIYVIPYTSIIDQNAQAIRKALGSSHDGQILEHHSNILLEFNTDENKGENRYWNDETYKQATETWDVPVILTTAVQFLNTCFGKGSSEIRRLNALSRSVIIFDEVQALPMSSTYLFNGMVNFLTENLKTSVVLCTATQPVLDRLRHEVGCLRLPEESQIIRNYADYYEEFERNRKVNLRDLSESSEWNAEEHAEFIQETARQKGNTLVIVNTKAWARTLYQLCLSDEFEICHLSTSMCPAHRKEIICGKISKEAMNGGAMDKSVICISTQLIEAGVDVDFDVVIRSCAGLDSVVQAAGRCNRDSRREQGEVIIVHPNSKQERISALKEICAGRDTLQRVLDEYDNVAQHLFSEGAMQNYFLYYLHEFDQKMKYPVKVENVSTSILDLLSGNGLARGGYERVRNCPPSDCLCQSFKSAAESYSVIENNTISVLTSYGRGKFIIEELNSAMKKEKKVKEDWGKIRALLREAQQYSISLWNEEKTLNELRRLGIIEKSECGLDFYVLTSGYYDDEMGFLSDKNGFSKVSNWDGYQC